MIPRLKQNRIEWSFIALMIVLCAVLTLLQYRWTGELARAESAQLRTNLEGPLQQLCHDFDAELTASCLQLTPTAAEIDAHGRETAHLDRVRQWLAGKPRPMFRRIALAVRSGSTLQLLALDARSSVLAPMDWPPEWSGLRGNLTPRIATPGGPRFVSSTGTLLDFPVFGGPRGRGGPNIGWMILELDAAYVRDIWFPALVRAHLPPGSAFSGDVEVKTSTLPASVIYSSTASGTPMSEPQISLQFNNLGRSSDDRNGPPGSARWVLGFRQHSGALEAVVSATRRRNLAVSIVLIVMILAAGVALLRFTRRSRELAETQMDFVANVSHELRTPLTVIRGAAHNLQRGVVRDPERVEQYAGLIVQHAEQLTEMVGQVLESAEAKRKPPLPDLPVALAEVLREAVATTAAETEAAHCGVALDVPLHLPTVNGDAVGLRRVFQNLITNAAKHGGKGGWIGITALASNGSNPPMLEVRVTDRGAGIPRDEQADIFHPFIRGSRAQAEQTRGSGLGLSLVREVIEAHHGTVSVSSEPGRGAAFIIRLPAGRNVA